MSKAVRIIKDLDFSPDQQGALNGGIKLLSDGGKDWVPWHPGALQTGFNGKIAVGKIVLPPFLRHYCELTFKDGRLMNSRSFIID